jgi:hypothetical protein
MGLLVLRQFSVCKHAIACTPAGSLAFVAHGSAYSNRSPYRHDSGLPQVSGGSAPAYDFSRPPRRSQLSYGLLTRHTAERRVFLEGFDGFVTSTATPIATGWSDLCRVGIAPTEKLHLFTTHRHPPSPPSGEAEGSQTPREVRHPPPPPSITPACTFIALDRKRGHLAARRVNHRLSGL